MGLLQFVGGLTFGMLRVVCFSRFVVLLFNFDWYYLVIECLWWFAVCFSFCWFDCMFVVVRFGYLCFAACFLVIVLA